MNIINKLRTGAIATVLVAIALLATPSCKDSTIDVFEQTPAERFDARSTELKNRLIDSPNGWIMEFVPHHKALYGGYIIGFKFNDKGEVLIASEALENTAPDAKEVLKSPIKSSYSIGQDNGIALNFTDYNEALHYYSTPDRRYAGGLAKGYEGDYEFRFMKSDDPNELNFIGKKTGNKIRMYKAPEDMVSYVTKVVETKRKFFSSKQMLANHQDALIVKSPILGNDNVKLYYPTVEGYNYYAGKKSEDSEDFTRLNFFCTPTGIKFFDHKTGQTAVFTWNEDKQIFENGDNVLEARDDPYYEDYASFIGDYSLEVIVKNGVDKYDVKISEAGHNLYLITGLPYTIRARYNYKKKHFEIQTQDIDEAGTKLAAWGLNTTERGSLDWTRGYGMYSQLEEGSTPARYKMVDNGVWGLCDSFILWHSKSGEAKQYKPSRIANPVFVRK